MGMGMGNGHARRNERRAQHLRLAARTGAVVALAGLDGSTGAGQEATPSSDGDSNDNGLDTRVAGAVPHPVRPGR